MVQVHFKAMYTVLSGIHVFQGYFYGWFRHSSFKKLKEIFDTLRNYNMLIHPHKCEFLRKECTYLAHFITDVGVKPDLEKLFRNFQFQKIKNKLNQS